MKIFLVAAFIMSIFVGCTPMPAELSSKSKVKVRMPASTNQLGNRHLKSSSSGPRSIRIASLNDIDCYAIVVSWDSGVGICSTATPSVVIAKAQMAFGSIPDGDTIEIEVDSGLARTIHIIGFSESSGTCPDFKSLTQAQRTTMSNPFLVGSTTADLIGPTVEVDITISMTGSQEITGDCENLPFEWEIISNGVWDSSNWDSANWAP